MSSRMVFLGGFLALACLAFTPVNGALALQKDTDLVEVGHAILGDNNDPRVEGIDYMPIYDPAAEQLEALTGASVADAGNLLYGGGLIQKSNMQYICYWGWTSDPSGEKPYFEGFVANVGGSTWMSVDNQYYSSSQGNILNPTGILKGTWADNTAVSSHPSQTDVNNAGMRCMNHFGYNQAANYIVATPSGHSQSGFGTRWCAYHEGLSSSSGTVSVTYLPYITDAGTSCGKNFVNAGSAGLLDGVSMVGGHEILEAQSDPKPCTGWCDSGGSENADKCAWSSMSRNIALGGKNYAVQPIWSNKISGCSVTG